MKNWLILFVVLLLQFVYATQVDAFERRGYRSHVYVGAGASYNDLEAEAEGAGAFDFEDETIGGTAFVGFQFNEYFGIEGGYNYFGNFQDDLSAPVKIERDIDVQTFYTDVLVYYPFDSIVSIYVRAGAHYWDLETEVRSLGVEVDADENGVDFTGGLGLRADFKVWAVRAEWRRFMMDEGDVDVDLDMFGLGVILMF